MRKLAFFLFVVSLALFAGQAHAQRCLPKMKGIRLTAGMADGFYSPSSKESVNRPNNAMEVYLKELGSESPMLVRLIMRLPRRDEHERHHRRRCILHL